MKFPLKNKLFTSLALFLFVFISFNLSASNSVSDFEFTSNPEGVSLKLIDDNGALFPFEGSTTLNYADQAQGLEFDNGVAILSEDLPEGLKLFTIELEEETLRSIYHISDKGDYWRFKKIPLWYSIIPPLLAIGMALVFKEVIISLFFAVWMGAYIVNGMELSNILSSLFKVADTYAINVLQDSGHLSIIIFSLIIGAMVAIINKNGGMQGIVDKLTPFAKNSKMAQFITWLMGVLIFFDDYANTLVVGNTMRSLTDRFKISREKLAYIVDSTAAPIASIAFVTTWIGAELGYIESALVQMEIDESAYSIFLNSLKYAYYPIFTLIFILFIIFLQKDFGPMKAAEDASKDSHSDVKSSFKQNIDEEMMPKEGVRARWYNAFFPVLFVVLGTMGALVYTGYDAAVWQGDMSFLDKLSTTIGNADSYQALIWASLLGLVTAMTLSIAGKILSLQETADSILVGFKSLLQPVVILVAAWSLAILTDELHTSTFLISVVEGKLSVAYMPFITFILAAFTAFSTGSSWSTMAILYPIILPTAYALGIAEGIDINEMMPVFYHLAAVVIGGSVLGDHCSPISDTTILSSLASGCDHLSHVRTQMPYALLVGGVTILCGTLFFAWGLPWWLGYPVGLGMLFGVVKFA